MHNSQNAFCPRESFWFIVNLYLGSRRNLGPLTKQLRPTPSAPLAILSTLQTSGLWGPEVPSCDSIVKADGQNRRWWGQDVCESLTFVCAFAVSLVDMGYYSLRCWEIKGP
jgi:hypothetical protein